MTFHALLVRVGKRAGRQPKLIKPVLDRSSLSFGPLFSALSADKMASVVKVL